MFHLQHFHDVIFIIKVELESTHTQIRASNAVLHVPDTREHHLLSLQIYTPANQCPSVSLECGILILIFDATVARDFSTRSLDNRESVSPIEEYVTV